MMKIDIKQKIYAARYCVGLPRNYEEIIRGLIGYFKDILGSFSNDEDINILCCYSYDIKPNIVKNKGTNNLYIILDMHLFDYYIDFFRAYKDSNKFTNSYMLKYLSEIYYSKGYTFDSVYFDELYHKSKIKDSHENIKQDIKVGTVSMLFVLLHEIMHLKPDISAKKYFTNLFNKDMKNILSDCYLEIKSDEKKHIDESYCDFTSLHLLYEIIEKTCTFEMSKRDVCEICLSTLLSIVFLDLLNDIENTNATSILDGEIFERFIISNMFAYGLGFSDVNDLFLNLMDRYIDLIYNVGYALSSLFDDREDFEKRKDISDLMENKIQKMKNLKKNKWIEIL